MCATTHTHDTTRHDTAHTHTHTHTHIHTHTRDAALRRKHTRTIATLAGPRLPESGFRITVEERGHVRPRPHTRARGGRMGVHAHLPPSLVHSSGAARVSFFGRSCSGGCRYAPTHSPGRFRYPKGIQNPTHGWRLAFRSSAHDSSSPCLARACPTKRALRDHRV